MKYVDIEWDGPFGIDKKFEANTAAVFMIWDDNYQVLDVGQAEDLNLDFKNFPKRRRDIWEQRKKGNLRIYTHIETDKSVRDRLVDVLLGRGIPPGRLYIKKEERINNIRFVLNAARYHWKIAIGQAREGKDGDPRPMFHIRSMLWEVYSSFDYLLHFANEELNLDFDPKDVKWEQKFEEKLKGAHQLFYDEVEELVNNYNFKVIKTLRNHSHKWVLGRNGYTYMSHYPEDLKTGKKTHTEYIQLNTFLDKDLPRPPAINEDWIDGMEKLISKGLKILGVSL